MQLYKTRRSTVYDADTGTLPKLPGFLKKGFTERSQTIDIVASHC